MNRLSNATLTQLPVSVARPAYDRHTVQPGIVHLGIGAFHRAHMAVMTDQLLGQDPHWGIIAASLRQAETQEALAPQDGLYTVVTQSAQGESLQVIGAVQRLLVAPENPEALIAAMADPRIKIVSLTVTEKGYCHDPATGALNEQHPDILHDLASPGQPRSAPGFLLAALDRRRGAGIPPFTVLCCDNLPSNGKTVRRVLIKMAELISASLGIFVRQEVAFPCTMVDRIVPATTDEDRRRIAHLLGVRDAWPVVTEPFVQWVIEDHFPLGRPRWELSGAHFTQHVDAFEQMKLRCLNGAHSTLAYLGSLAGHETVAEAASDPRFIQVLRGFWEEVRPSLHQTEGQDLLHYCEALLVRFQNRAIRHRLLQIAMDGSQKLPQRLLGTIRDNLTAGRPITVLTLGVAAWMAHVAEAAKDGAPFDLSDPLRVELEAAAKRANNWPERLADTLLQIEPIFGKDLATHASFRHSLLLHLDRLMTSGARAAIAGVSR